MIMVITGICSSCGMFQTNPKFVMFDTKDNAATNFIVCNSCFLRYNVIESRKLVNYFKDMPQSQIINDISDKDDEC